MHIERPLVVYTTEINPDTKDNYLLGNISLRAAIRLPEKNSSIGMNIFKRQVLSRIEKAFEDAEEAYYKEN